MKRTHSSDSTHLLVYFLQHVVNPQQERAHLSQLYREVDLQTHTNHKLKTQLRFRKPLGFKTVELRNTECSVSSSSKPQYFPS